jgi:hypothetical protein
LCTAGGGGGGGGGAPWCLCPGAAKAATAAREATKTRLFFMLFPSDMFFLSTPHCAAYPMRKYSAGKTIFQVQNEKKLKLCSNNRII